MQENMKKTWTHTVGKKTWTHTVEKKTWTHTVVENMQENIDTHSKRRKHRHTQ